MNVPFATDLATRLLPLFYVFYARTGARVEIFSAAQPAQGGAANVVGICRCFRTFTGENALPRVYGSSKPSPSGQASLASKGALRSN
jgi:hypothetical protein